VLNYVQHTFPGGENCVGALSPLGYGPAHKAHVYTLFKIFSNQQFCELHENVKKIT